MASPPDYDSENMPLISDISNEDDSQMCKQLLRWLDENNLGNQDLISISSLKDALTKTTLSATRNNSKAPGFARNKVHFPSPPLVISGDIYVGIYLPV